MSCVQDKGKDHKRVGLGSIARKVTSLIIFLAGLAPIITLKDTALTF